MRCEQVEAFLAGGGVARVVQIHQDDVEVAALERAQQLLRRCRGLDVEAFALQQQPQRLEDVGLIVGEQDPQDGGSQSGSSHQRPSHPSRSWITRLP